MEYDVLRPPLVPEQLPPHISPASILSGAVSAEDLDWHLSQSFQYPTLDVVVLPTTQSSWEEEHTQRMTPPEAVGAGTRAGVPTVTPRWIRAQQRLTVFIPPTLARRPSRNLSGVYTWI